MLHKFSSTVKFFRRPLHFPARYLQNSSKYPEPCLPSPMPSNRKRQKLHRLLEPYKAMNAIRIEENPDALVKIFKEASYHPRFHRHRSVYAITVKKLAQAGRPDAVEEILEHEKDKPQLNSNEGFMLRIITLYGQAGMPYHAVKTFRLLPQLNIEPGVKSLNALLNSLVTLSWMYARGVWKKLRRSCSIVVVPTDD